LRVIGLGESVLDERIAPLYKGVENPKVGVLFSAFDVEVHLTATALSEEEADALNEELAVKMREALGAHVYAEAEISLAGAVGLRLTERQESLAVVDIATGGLVAQRLSDVKGSESFLKLGLALPSVEAAANWLTFDTNSNKAVLAEHLAEAVRQKTGAVHGLAILCEPPDENRFQKFIIALSSGAPQTASEVTFPGDLELRRSRAAQGALDVVRRIILPL
jgi:nicotinamide-nucleotide amidase